MRINSVPDVKCFVIIKMCYVYNEWYDISCATLYIFMFFIFSSNNDGLHLTALLSHTIPPQVIHLSYGATSYLFPIDERHCRVLPTILSQPFVLRRRL